MVRPLDVGCGKRRLDHIGRHLVGNPGEALAGSQSGQWSKAEGMKSPLRAADGRDKDDTDSGSRSVVLLRLMAARYRVSVPLTTWLPRFASDALL